MTRLIRILDCLGIRNAISLDDDHNQQSVHKGTDVLIDNVIMNSRR